MLMVIGYFVLRNAIDDTERQAVYAAVFGIIAFINAPISLLITRLVPTSVHPVILRSDSGLPPPMLLPFLLALFGMLLVATGLYRFRLREQRLSQRLAILKDQLLE
jgi:heme exporter protein C